MRQAKVMAKLLSVALVLGVCGIADAKKASPKKAGVHGVIESVQRAQSQITVKIGSAKKGNLHSVRIVIGPNTAIQLKKSAAGSFTSLHAGDRVIIEPDTSNPTTIIDEGGSRRHHARLIK